MDPSFFLPCKKKKKTLSLNPPNSLPCAPSPKAMDETLWP